MEYLKMRVRELDVPGYPGQTQTQLQTTLRCPHCGRVDEHILEKRSDVWRWGLDQRIETTVEELLLREDLLSRPHVTIVRVFYCKACGMGSIVTESSLKLFIGELYTAVGHLHEGFGEPWGLNPLEDYMLKHLELEDKLYPSGGYYFHRDTQFGRIDEFFLRLCPCKLCDRSRKSDHMHIQLADRHLDLEYYRSKLPEFTQLDVLCFS